VCVAMLPTMQRGGIFRCWLSFSAVQRDSVGGGVALRRLSSGGLLGWWGVAVYNEEMVVQPVKRAGMTPLAAAPGRGIVFLVGSDGGTSLAPLILGKGHHRRRRTWVLWSSLESLRGLTGSDDGDVYAVTPMGTSSLETYIDWRNVWTALVARWWSPRAYRMETKAKQRGINHRQ
jgi:hypothetical protein